MFANTTTKFATIFINLQISKKKSSNCISDGVILVAKNDGHVST